MKNCIVMVTFVFVLSVLVVQAERVPRASGFRPNVRITSRIANVGTTPPADIDCRLAANRPCYSPQEIQRAYGLTTLVNAGYTGVGQTIIIIDSFGSPTLEDDLRTFDAGYGLPDPPSLTVLAPLGTVPFDYRNPSHRGWAVETTLDVEWAHAMAPGANIVVLTSPVDETQGVQGMPEFLFLEQFALDNGLGKIISQSWGATENTLFDDAGRQVLEDFERFYEKARDANITVLASSGDTGSTNHDVFEQLYPFRTVGFPASSPLVTAVGGTSLYADTDGNYQYEAVWNDRGASGGGVSQYFVEPDYQIENLPASTQELLNQHRAIPDIALNGDPSTGILIYVSFPGVRPGYYLIGGTSAGSPQWAGIVAILNQLAGHPLGFLNTGLYGMGKSGEISRFIHDVTIGNNDFGNVRGYDATPGWDLATGWGTPDLTNLLSESAAQ